MDRLSPIRTRLWEKLGAYMDDSQIQFVFRAYQFAARAHEGQTRQSGIPYICHPLAVAEILADLHLDAKTISAAIMHDIIEDTEISKHELAQHFGNDVADMVDGVSKLAQVKFNNQMEKEATNLRKMLMAMTQDVRIIIIKLGDRLHNMRTLAALKPEKQRRIARETLDIYAPIANRLGMNELRLELEKLGFMYLYPDRYRVLSEAVDRVRGNRRDIIERIETELQENLRENIPHVKVLGRQKHLYSLYKKMRFKHLNFGEVLDVYAFRIIVNDVMECYQALGIIHSLYNPIPGKFKDYIALPKSNGYQSLHTILVGPHGVPIEVQIRTREMDKISEHGLAAHWSYKQGNDHSGAQRRAREWLRQLLENQKMAGTPTEFLENIKIDLFPDEVYVFTPKGRVITLPYGATPIDFAYAIHSQVGNHCVSALVDHEEVSLATQLISGQQVEIITDENSRPDPNWLNFVATARARNQIRHALKTLEKDEVIALGKKLMQTTLKQYHTSLHEFGRKQIQSLLKEMHVENIEALYEKIGSGRVLAPIVCRILFENNDTRPQKKGFRNMLGHLLPGWLKSKPRPEALTIQGTEGMAIRFAGCCQPIPGDPIRGLITSGRGIVVHTDDCKNVKAAKKDKGAWVSVRWDEQPKREFPVTIRTYINNKRGTLATVAAAISEMEANIENVEIQQKNAKISTTEFTISVKNRQHLAQIIRHVRNLDCVRQVFRIKH
ncbi:MAG: bifunctional (p)ppGpp synthetase/guanosine-3',5'-bis(diphosphate) 3'-pyrophosphohydrolase [Gammaproteobacteria bacterium]|nr:MAG: bifunctional (p)ppGpp synthetase/guanosine-3',5'-bis(diphosphate) 3'-pyrophosphohydrolase [Gammaproteobacteria bacterium]